MRCCVRAQLLKLERHGEEVALAGNSEEAAAAQQMAAREI